MIMAALLAAPALAEDWTVVDTTGEFVEFRVAGPASWQKVPHVEDGAVTRSFIHVDSEPLLQRGLVAAANYLERPKGSIISPGDLPEPSLSTFAAEAATNLTAGLSDVETRLVSHDVVSISGLNALRMVVETEFEAPAGRMFELSEANVLAYERESDESHVVISLVCSYRGLAADREATLSRFEAERGPVCERFAGSLALLDKPSLATAPPEGDR
jgi:hypothetical protein